jgi:hypothetical protein
MAGGRHSEQKGDELSLSLPPERHRSRCRSHHLPAAVVLPEQPPGRLLGPAGIQTTSTHEFNKEQHKIEDSTGVQGEDMD